MDKIIDHQISSGIDALVIGGTTGEAATLSDDERTHLYSYVKEKVAGRAKLILGVGTNDTRMSVKYTRLAESIGCDGVLAVTPYYNKGTFSGVESHYLAIAEASSLPVILYNVPGRTGVNLTMQQLSRLSQHPNINSIKEASDSADRLVSIAAFGEELRLIAGNDSQIYTVLALGGDGVISVVSNLLPKQTAKICNSFLSGDYKESLIAQTALLPLINALFLETNPTPIKYALSQKGLCTEEVRLPLSSATDATKNIIASLMQE